MPFKLSSENINFLSLPTFLKWVLLLVCVMIYKSRIITLIIVHAYKQTLSRLIFRPCAHVSVGDFHSDLYLPNCPICQLLYNVLSNIRLYQNVPVPVHNIQKQQLQTPLHVHRSIIMFLSTTGLASTMQLFKPFMKQWQKV